MPSRPAEYLSPLPAPARAMPDPGSGATRFDHPEIDSETAALLRAWLRPLIEGADSWDALARALASRGHSLAFRDGRLMLVDDATGRRICTARFLGTPLRDLVSRLGRPMVLLRRDRPAAADLLTGGRRGLAGK